MSKAERKRLIDLQAMVTADEVMVFSVPVMAGVHDCITDWKTLPIFQTGMQRIFEERNGRVGFASSLAARAAQRGGPSAERCLPIPHA